MKLTRERTSKRILAAEAAGLESPTTEPDSREVVRGRWDEIMTVVVERLVAREVENTNPLVELMDLFHHNRAQLFGELRSRLGPEKFGFEYMRPILDKISFGEDEAAMSSREPDPLFMTRIKKPKAVLLKVLFPEKAEELLDIVKPAVDEVIEKPFDFPSPFVEALRLDPSRAHEIRAAAAQKKEGMITRSLGYLRVSSSSVGTSALETIASYVLIFPEERTRILSEFSPQLETARQRLPTKLSCIDVINAARALEIIFHGAELNSNGIFEIQFPKPLTQPLVLPTRPIV